MKEARYYTRLAQSATVGNCPVAVLGLQKPKLRPGDKVWVYLLNERAVMKFYGPTLESALLQYNRLMGRPTGAPLGLHEQLLHADDWAKYKEVAR